jgi:hypothetical protein
VPNGRRPVSRGVARRNAKLAALRALVTKDRAIVAVDLAGHRQAAVVCDHDSVVLGRRMFNGTAWCISEILAWAEPAEGHVHLCTAVRGPCVRRHPACVSKTEHLIRSKIPAVQISPWLSDNPARRGRGRRP